MSYGNVGTPRFYIDWGLYHSAKGTITVSGGMSELHLLNPSKIRDFDSTDGYTVSDAYFDNVEDTNYAMILGHNFSSTTRGCYIEGHDDTGAISVGVIDTINQEGVGAGDVLYNGYTVFTARNNDKFNFSRTPTAFRWVFRYDTGAGSSSQFKIGALSVGHYYDMPFSPDLSLSMSHDYDGVKTTKTKGGATLSNTDWTKPPKWGNLEAWQLSDPTDTTYYQDWHYSGRRVWDLSFNYISDSDLEPTNYATAPDYITANGNFFTDVIHKTIGGSLPFIFQPDNDVNDFAIARFDMNSFKRTQVANNVYNIKLKIEESW